MKKYTSEVSLKPEIHEGAMKQYWKITLHLPEGQFTIADGWEADAYVAHFKAYRKAQELKLV